MEGLAALRRDARRAKRAFLARKKEEEEEEGRWWVRWLKGFGEDAPWAWGWATNPGQQLRLDIEMEEGRMRRTWERRGAVSAAPGPWRVSCLTNSFRTSFGLIHLQRA